MLALERRGGRAPAVLLVSWSFASQLTGSWKHFAITLTASPEVAPNLGGSIKYQYMQQLLGRGAMCADFWAAFQALECCNLGIALSHCRHRSLPLTDSPLPQQLLVGLDLAVVVAHWEVGLGQAPLHNDESPIVLPCGLLLRLVHTKGDLHR